MGLRFEFDSVNKILLARFEVRLSDESLVELYSAIRQYFGSTDARGGIVDLSSVTEFSVSSESIRQLAQTKPAITDMTRPRIIVAPSPEGFGLARMFQSSGIDTRPLLGVVRTLEEALAALDIQAPHFEPLE